MISLLTIPVCPAARYRTLRISALGSQLSDAAVEDGLFHEFRRFGDVTVTIGRHDDERVALVNFRHHDDARAAKHAPGKLVLFERPLTVQTVYPTQAPPSSGYHDYRLQAPAPQDVPLFDPRPGAGAEQQRANRTLFLGNLDVCVTEPELRRAFERFGAVTEVDIKQAASGRGAYGFVKFENLDMAHRAKAAMSGRRLGLNALRIGYGKPTPSKRLWVGGLGPWAPLAALAKEFDRFGAIRTIDYRQGDASAFVQYDSLDAATAACGHMHGFPLGGTDRRLRVDFADTECRHQTPPPYDLLPLAVRHPERSPPPPAHFRDRDAFARFDSFNHLERRPRDVWSLERDEPGQKRRHLEDGWRPDRSPCTGEYDDMRRHSGSMERSNGGNRTPRSARSSPLHERLSDVRDKRKRRRSGTAGKEQPDSAPCRSNQRLKVEPDGGGEQRPVWRGVLLLKNSRFPATLHLLRGDGHVAAALLAASPAGGAVSPLKISQRLRLDATKMDDLSRRIRTAGNGGFAVLLALPGTDGEETDGGSTQRPLKNLVSYLTAKEAAGVVSLPVGGAGRGHGGVLHVFPPCEFTHQFLDESVKSLVKSEDEFMVMVMTSS